MTFSDGEPLPRPPPARALAAVLLQAWAMSANRESALGRPPGEWAGPSRSLGALAAEIRFAGMRPRP